MKRGVALEGRRSVVVEDEVQAKKSAELWWFVSTPAQIEVDAAGRNARLRLNSKQMVAELLSPAEAKFTVLKAEPLPSSPNPPKQKVNRGISRLTVHLPGVTETRISVRFSPGTVTPGAAEVSPLANW